MAKNKVDQLVAIDGEESRGWYSALDKETKAAVRALSKINPWYNLIIPMFIIFWVGGAFAMAAWPAWPVQVAGSLLIGLAIHGMFNLMHEGIHGNLFRKKKIDRWLAFLMGLPTLSSSTTYKIIHMKHHYHNRTEEDPNEIMNVSKDKRIISLVFYLAFLFGLQMLVMVSPVLGYKLADKKSKKIVVWEYVFIVFFYAALLTWLITAGYGEQLLRFWGIPLLIAAFMGNVRIWAEHLMTLPGNPLTQSRTVTSNKVSSFLLVNSNYHLEHHLVPGMPWYNLPRLHVLMQDAYRKAGAFNYKTYWQFLWDAIRIGVHGLAPELVPHPLYPSGD